MNKKVFSVFFAALLIWSLAALNSVLAQKFPNKPITIIVPFAPGGSADIITRVLTAHAHKEFNVPVVVENIAEAAGVKGLSTVYNATPDGYTLISAVLPRHAQPEIVLGAPVKILNYTYIMGFQKDDMLVAVRKESDYKSFEELKNASSKLALSCSIGGMGGTSHLCALILQKELGMRFDIVPFKGNAPSMVALLGGHVDFTLMDDTTLLLHADRIRCFAIFGPERLKKFPGVPTFRELGYKIEVGVNIKGVLGPPNLPQERVQVLEEGFSKTMEKKEVLDQIDKLGGIPYYVSGKELYKFTKAGYDKIVEYRNLFK